MEQIFLKTTLKHMKDMIGSLSMVYEGEIVFN